MNLRIEESEDRSNYLGAFWINAKENLQELRIRELTSNFNKLSEELTGERDNLREIMNSLKDGVYIVDQQNNIEYVNPTIEKEFGPVKNQKCYKYFHDRTDVCPWCKNQEVFAGKSVEWEWYSIKTNKTYD